MFFRYILLPLGLLINTNINCLNYDHKKHGAHLLRSKVQAIIRGQSTYDEVLRQLGPATIETSPTRWLYISSYSGSNLTTRETSFTVVTIIFDINGIVTGVLVQKKSARDVPICIASFLPNTAGNVQFTPTED